MLARLSGEPAKFLESINSLLSFRMPTGRECPKCQKVMEQGRMPGSGTIFTVCSNCHSVLTDLETLGHHNEPLMRALAADMNSTAPVISKPAPPEASMDPRESAWTQRLGEEIDKVRQTFEKTLQETQKNNTELDRKCREQESQIQELKNRLETAGKQWTQLNETLANREKEREQKYSEEVKKVQQTVEEQVQKNMGETLAYYTQRLEAQTAAAESLTKKNAEQKNEIEELKQEIKKTQNLHEKTLNEKLTSRQVEHIQQLESLHKQIRELTQRLADTEKTKSAPLPHPAPAPAPTPIAAPPMTAASTPKPAPQPAPLKFEPPIARKEEPKKTLPTIPPGPAKPSLISRLIAQFKAAWSPVPRKPAVIVPKPAPAAQLAPNPLPRPVVVPAPIPRPAFSPAQTITKPKRKWLDLLIGWGPRWIALLIFLSVYAVSLEGPVYALSWAMITAGFAMMIRLGRMYPFKNSAEMTVAQLNNLSEGTPWRGVSVTLNGHLNADPANKKPIFEDSSGAIPLSLTGPIELWPHIFGLVTKHPFPKGEFTLEGWYRRDTVPFVEVSKARDEKSVRKSYVRGARWSTAIFLIVFGIIFLISQS
jgi:hypothetical protein